MLWFGDTQGDEAMQALLPTERSGAQSTKRRKRREITSMEDMFCRTIALWVGSRKARVPPNWYWSNFVFDQYRQV